MPAPLPKVACRTRSDLVIHQGSHGATYNGGPTSLPGLIVRHYPYRSAAQFVSKVRNGAAAYASTDLPVTEGQHWRQYGQLLEAHGAEVVEDVCLLYTSDAADDLRCVDLGGRRIIKKKKHLISFKHNTIRLPL